MHPTTQRLLAWYRCQGRDLPWRREPTPYHTLLSEIMLQQTRVETVIPYYQRFLVRWPTVEALAQAPIEEVLKAWAGLGYYRRARNLHRAAGQIAALGTFPHTQDGLRQLAGVGEYTAAAIASIALGQDALAVDGNLRRVVARLAAIDEPILGGPGGRRLRRWLEERLPSGLAGDFNQALMDLGATTCLPQAPRCRACPSSQDCLALERGLVDSLPHTPARRSPRPVRAVALLVNRDGALLLRQRPATGLLAGLWGPPDQVLAEGQVETRVVTVFREELGVPPSALPIAVGNVEHVFTHQRWRVQVYQVEVPMPFEAPSGLIWWLPETADAPPLSRLAEKLLALRTQQCSGKRRPTGSRLMSWREPPGP